MRANTTVWADLIFNLIIRVLAMFKIILAVLFGFCLIPFLIYDECQESCDCKSRCNVCRNGPVTTLCLKNLTYYDMGYMYGKTLEFELKETLTTLKNYYETMNISYRTVVAHAEMFHDTYNSVSFLKFLNGIANGSSLTMDDCKVLNGMETLGSMNMTLMPESATLGSSFVYVPPQLSKSKSGIVARNYDDASLFGTIAGKSLIVTVIADSDKLPVATIGMPGQIYCPSCINSENIFAELNNGAAMANGKVSSEPGNTLLLDILEDLQEADSLRQMSLLVKQSDPDQQSIVNIADSKRLQSVEFFKEDGVKTYTPEKNHTFVSSDLFKNNMSLDLSQNLDTNVWIGLQTENNLKKLLDKPGCDVDCVKSAMDVTLDDGGALWPMTIYQLIYDMNSQYLFVRAPHYTFNWTKIELGNYFADALIDVSSRFLSNTFIFNCLATIGLLCLISFETIVNVKQTPDL